MGKSSDLLEICVKGGGGDNFLFDNLRSWSNIKLLSKYEINLFRIMFCIVEMKLNSSKYSKRRL